MRISHAKAVIGHPVSLVGESVPLLAVSGQFLCDMAEDIRHSRIFPSWQNSAPLFLGTKAIQLKPQCPS
jgi:hypothetical protein